MKPPNSSEEQKRFFEALHRLHRDPDFEFLLERIRNDRKRIEVTLVEGEGVPLHRAQGAAGWIDRFLRHCEGALEILKSLKK